MPRRRRSRRSRLLRVGRRARVAILLASVVIAVAAAYYVGRDPAAASAEAVRRGDEFVAAQQFAEAAISYENAVKADPRSGEARHKLAKAHYALGNIERAAREFVRAADLLPGDAAAQLDAANILLVAGAFEDARTRADALLKIDPRNIDAHVVRGNAAAGLRDLNTAVADIQKGLALAPDRGSLHENLATINVARGDLKTAEAEFGKAIALDPRAPTGYAALAGFYWATNDIARAEETLMKGLAIAPGSVALNQAIATLYLSVGRGAEAEQPLKTVIVATDDLQPRLTLADYYTSQNRWDEARALLGALVKRREAFAAAKGRLAGIEYAAGRRAQAHRILDEVLKREPSNVQVLGVKGRWLVAEHRLPDALSTAFAAVAAAPQSADGHRLLAVVQLARRRPQDAIKAYTDVLRLRPDAADAQIALANLYVTTGNTTVAAQFAEQAVRNQPRSGAARLARGRVLYAMGKLEPARADAQLVIDAAPTLAVAQTLMGQIEQARRNFPAARQSFERALEHEPSSFDALAGLVALDLEENRVADARRRVERQLTGTPAPGVVLLAARLYAADDDLPAAEKVLKKAIEHDPSLVDAYNLLGEVYVRQNRLEEARREYEKVADQRADAVDAHTMSGVIFQLQGRPGDARKAYEAALAIDGGAPVAANNLAYMDAETGSNLDAALTLAQAAKAALPNDADINDTLGWIYYKKGQLPLAIASLSETVTRDPSNPTFRYHLGVAYAKAGNTKRAREHLTQALALSGDFSEVAEARRVLASLSS